MSPTDICTKKFEEVDPQEKGSRTKEIMKANKLKFGVMVMAASLALGTTSCKKGCTDPESINYDESVKKDDGSCIEAPVTENGDVIPKAGFIQTETWTTDNVYELTGKVVVESGHTLTIEPGTIIKAKEGSGTLASALVIRQGARINAVGTPTQPIIFTSILDNIKTGELTGTNLSEADQGLWGGVVILGYAPISAADGDAVAQIEGFPVTDAFGAFGGSDATDNSGTMEYVSIRHGGALIGAGNEINGLTLGGVGTGTSISNIEIVSNLDDGIEFFGGTVDVTNVLVGFQGDDGIDIDMNYAGTVSNFVVINGNNSDEAMEVDGPEGSTHTDGLFNLENGTVYTFGGTEARGDFKSKAQGKISNVKMGEAKIRASYQNDCADPKTDAFTYLTQVSPKLTFVDSEFSATTVYTASQDDAAVNDCVVFPADQSVAEGVMVSTPATGAISSVFTGWTWCSVNGKLQ